MDRISLALLILVLSITLAVKSWFTTDVPGTGTPVVAAAIAR